MQEQDAKAGAVRGRLRLNLTSVIPFAALILLVLLFAITAGDRFLTLGNIAILLQQSAVLAVVGFGMTMVIIEGSIDLSVGSVMAVSGMIGATAGAQMGGTAGVITGILVGTACGMANGFFFTKLRIPSFIVTLGMFSIARGLTIIFSHGFPVGIYNSFEVLGSWPTIAYVTAVVFAFTHILYTRTTFGRYTAAVGGDERVAGLSGVRVNRQKFLVFTYSGLLAGLGGVMLAARVGAATATAATGFEMDVISAVVLGGTPLTGGIGSVLGTLVGALIISTLTNGLVILGVSSDVQMVIRGFILMLAVFISLERGKIGIIK